MQKHLFAALFFMVLSTFALGQLNMSLLSQIDYEVDCSDVWGYAAPDGREYAIVGLYDGVSIVDVTEPANATEVVRIPGDGTNWRDIKTFGEFAYIVGDGGFYNDGLGVIDLRNLPESAEYYTWTGDFGSLQSCHNLFIDEFGYAYLAGCNFNNGGVVFIDVFSDPGTPIFVGLGPDVYSHDVYTRDNKMYSSELWSGRMTIYDVTDKDEVVELGLQQTPFHFTHNVWLSDDSNVAFTTDELPDAPVAAYDVSDPNDIIELDQFRPLATIGTGVLPHNVHVWNDYLIISYYSDGGIIVDASRPNNLIEVGNFDTYFGTNLNRGAWGAYPYLPSGIVLISDRAGSLFVLDANYVRACHLEGQVTDALSGIPVSGVDIDILSDELNECVSGLDGSYGTGLVEGGEYEVRFSKPGYEDYITTANFENGVLVTLDVQLQPLPRYSRSGLVVAEDDGSLIADAQIVVDNGFDRFEFVTGPDGRFVAENVYEGAFDVSASKWGYQLRLVESVQIENNEDLSPFELLRGYKDDFASDLGWETGADENTTAGFWEIAEPIGSYRSGELANPEYDVEGDIGDECYVTGNMESMFVRDDIDRGAVYLTSPPMTLASNYIDPVITFKYWFVNRGVGPSNKFEIFLMNGVDTVLLAEYTEAVSEWSEALEFVVGDFIEITDEMRIQFVPSNFVNPNRTVEAAIDAFEILGEYVVNTDEPMLEVDWAVAPNPFSNDFNLSYQLPSWNSGATLRVVNALGQIVDQRNLPAEAATLEMGADWPMGIYFIQLEVPEEGRAVQRVVKQ